MAKDNQMNELRSQIDEIDEGLVTLIARRLGIAKAIGELKHTNGAVIEDLVREKEVLERVMRLARQQGIGDYMASLFEELIKTSKEVQNEVYAGISPGLSTAVSYKGG